MKALIYKDFLAIRKQLFLTLAILAILFVRLFGQGHYLAFPLGITMLCFMFPAMTFASDDQCSFARFAFSGPVTRSQYVLSKYVPGFALGIVGGVIAVLLSALVLENPVDHSLFYGACATVLPFLLIDLLLPLVFKLGAEKGRIVMVVMYFFLFSSFATARAFLSKAMAWIQSLQRMTFMQLGLMCLSAGVLISIASVFVSLRIVRNKEY